jgi:hypothetical protein
MLKTVNNVRYLNKNNNANERENYAKWWKEQIEHYGTSVSYFSHGYTLTSHNFLYGEDPTSRYARFDDLIVLTDITNDALMLSKFGIMADCDMTAVIHISSFYEKIGCGFEPKAGDLIQLVEYGADRPGGRSAPIYEITERDDEYLPMTNSLIGHYVWYIKCKRFEYSFEPGVKTGDNNKQINDTGDYGRLGAGENPEELFQPYPDSVQNTSKDIYDYYSEYTTGVGANQVHQLTSDIAMTYSHYVPPLPPSCPPGLTMTNLSAVLGPYSPDPNAVDYESMIAMWRSIAVNAESSIEQVVLSNVFASNSAENIDTFAATNSATPGEIINYTTTDDVLDLNTYDGGYV